MHIAVVEIDDGDGHRRPAQRYVAVDDCGNQVNPLIVEGQIHGGIVQGIAQALWEEAVYDDDGNLLTASLIDYLVPSAAELPSCELDQPSRRARPTARRQGHRRGRHDRGDARGHERDRRRARPLGITDIAMPASPQRVWAAITGGEAVIPAAFDYVRAGSAEEASRARPSTATTPSSSPAACR